MTMWSPIRMRPKDEPVASPTSERPANKEPAVTQPMPQEGRIPEAGERKAQSCASPAEARSTRPHRRCWHNS